MNYAYEQDDRITVGQDNGQPREAVFRQAGNPDFPLVTGDIEHRDWAWVVYDDGTVDRVATSRFAPRNR